MGSSDCSVGEYCNDDSLGYNVFTAFVVSACLLLPFLLLSLLLYYQLCCRIFHRLFSSTARLSSNDNISSRCELREMLSIIVFKESFYAKDTECSVCLGEYKADDKLKQIPVCGHTFHMNCIDHWLSAHSTCPLCRRSPLTPTRVSSQRPNTEAGETSQSHETDIHSEGFQHGEPQQRQRISSPAVLEESHSHISVHVDCG